LLVFFIALLLTGQACANRNTPPARRFELHGKIVAINQSRSEVTISHGPIPGYMDAMTMPFALKDTTLVDSMSPGDEINADLMVSDKSSWLENPIVSRTMPDTPSSIPLTARPEPSPGTSVPDFHLINQDGKRISLSQFRGKALAITFIYTRCPLPDYCILMNDNFEHIEKSLANNRALYAKTHLITISFYPARDTPEVLRTFGLARVDAKAANPFNHWEFATGDAAQIKTLADFFGLTYVNEPNQIIHSLRTAVISPNGSLYHLYDGNEWRPEQVIDDFQTVAEKQ
jgi:protein SCO1/2